MLHPWLHLPGVAGRIRVKCRRARGRPPEAPRKVAAFFSPGVSQTGRGSLGWVAGPLGGGDVDRGKRVEEA